MIRSAEVEIKVGIFVAVGLALTLLSILLVGGGQSFFQSGVKFHTRFNEIEGLVEGATVKISGVRVGQISEINMIKDTGQVEVWFTVAKQYADAIHQDSMIGVQTQGVLGDRYIVISTGTPKSPPLPPGSEIKSEAPKELKSYLNDADELLGRLKKSLGHMEGVLGSLDNSLNRDQRAETLFRNLTHFSGNVSDGTKNLRSSMDHLNSIFAKIDKGQGTIGALVNDPSLYDDLKTLLGGANRNRVLKYFIKKSVEDSRNK